MQATSGAGKVRGRWTAAGLALGAILCMAMRSGAIAGTHRDPRAVAVADATRQAIAPDGAWSKVACLRFTFSVVKSGAALGEFRHLWEPGTGQYRLEWKDKEGVERTVLFDVTNRKGRAYQKRSASGTGNTPDGGGAGAPTSPAQGAAAPPAQGGIAAPAPGAAISPAASAALPPATWSEIENPDEVKKLLEKAYGRYINDSYWLLMPLKMQDPGVNLASEGKTELGGKPYDVVRLTFDEGVGLTPRDTYWAYVSKTSGLMERWEMVLTGQEARDRAAYLWTDWQTIGGVRLALTKTSTDGSSVIRFDHVSGSGSPDDAAFTLP